MPLLPRAVLAVLFVGACQVEPQTSYCDALCDWTTPCATGERGYYPDYSEADTRASCIASAEAADADCAKAADGLDAASSTLLTQCTDAIDAMATAGECDAVTGRIDDLKLGLAPKACATQGVDAQATFDAARDGTRETNDQLCNRFAWTFCDQLQTCLLGSLGVASVDDIPSELVTAAGGTPFALCQEQFDGETSSCRDDARYAPEASLADANLMRQGARECLGDLSTVTCDDLTGGHVTAACAAAVEDPTIFVSALQEIGAKYLGGG